MCTGINPKLQSTHNRDTPLSWHRSGNTKMRRCSTSTKILCLQEIKKGTQTPNRRIERHTKALHATEYSCGMRSNVEAASKRRCVFSRNSSSPHVSNIRLVSPTWSCHLATPIADKFARLTHISLLWTSKAPCLATPTGLSTAPPTYC